MGCCSVRSGKYFVGGRATHSSQHVVQVPAHRGEHADDFASIGRRALREELCFSRAAVPERARKMEFRGSRKWDMEPARSSSRFSPGGPRKEATQCSPARKCWEQLRHEDKPWKGDTDCVCSKCRTSCFAPSGAWCRRGAAFPGLPPWATFCSHLRRCLW